MARHRRRVPLGPVLVRRALAALVAAVAVLPVPVFLGAGRTAALFSGTPGNPASTVATRSAFYADRVVASGPVSYWRLGETSGTTGADMMGVAPLTYVNVLLNQNGMNARDSNRSIRLENTGEYAWAPATAAHAFSGNLSVVAWLKSAHNPQPTIARLVTRNDGTYFTFHMAFDGPGTRLRFTVDTSNGRFEALATLPTDYAWHMHVGTYDGSMVRLYRDGVLVNSIAATGTTRPAPTAQTTIGVPGPTASAQGLIDEVALYGRALGQPEIAGLYTWATT